MESTKEITYTTDFKGFKIDVLWVEYDGGGMCYEYRVSRDGSILVETEDGYGGAAGAAAAAFTWIDEESDLHTISQEPTQTVQKIIERGAYRIVETPDYWVITKHERDQMSIARWTNASVTNTDIRFAGDLFLMDVILKTYEETSKPKPDPYRDLGFTSDFNFNGRGDYQPFERKERKRWTRDIE